MVIQSAKLSSSHQWRYDAFLSYSHATDTRLAPFLQRGLQRLTRPWYRRPALRVFRDQAILAANPDLWGTIEQALRGSGHFVLLASPAAAQSPWVEREVGFWRDRRERQKFLIALTDGTISWDRHAGDFDWDRTDALPQRMRGWFTAEPLWVDLTWTRAAKVEQLSLRSARFRDQVGTLAAAIHGRDKDELDSEDVRQHRIATLAGRAIALVLVALMVTAGVAAYNANQQRQIAQQQRSVAEQQRMLATLRALQAESQDLAATQPKSSLQLSLAALRIQPSAQIRAGLVSTLLHTRYLGESAPHASQPSSYEEAEFSPGARLLATAQGAGGGTAARLLLWNVTDPLHPAQVGTITNKNSFDSIAFSPDGRTLATSAGGTVTLWDVTAAPRRVATMAGVGPSAGVAFSPDGQTLATAGGQPDAGALILWDIHDRARPRRLVTRTGISDPGDVRFSPDGHLLVTASGTITGVSLSQITHTTGATIWNVSNPSAPRALGRIPHYGQGIAFSPDGRTLALGYGSAVLMWDITNPAAPREISTLTGHTDGIEALAFSPDGRTLASASLDDNAILWDVANPGQVTRSATLADDPAALSAVAFTADGQDLLTADWDIRVTRWRTTSAEPSASATLAGHTAAVEAVAISPDSQIVATASLDRTVILWDIADPARPVQLARLTDTLPVSALAFSPDGKTLVTGDWAKRLIFWDVSDAQRPRQLAVAPCAGEVNSIAFSPDGMMLAAAGSDIDSAQEPLLFQAGWASLWKVSDLAHPSQIRSFAGADPGAGATFSLDGRLLIVPGFTLGSQPTQIWSVANPATVTRLRASYSLTPALQSASADFGDHLALSPDGKTAATAGSVGGPSETGTEAVVLWRLSRPAKARGFAILTGPKSMINKIAFSPGGNLVAAGSDDMTTTVWDIADPSQSFSVDTMQGDTDAVTDVAFSADGRLLVTGSADGVARIWDLGQLPPIAANPVAAACAITGGALTPTQWAAYAPGIPYHRTCP